MNERGKRWRGGEVERWRGAAPEYLNAPTTHTKGIITNRRGKFSAPGGWSGGGGGELPRL